MTSLFDLSGQVALITGASRGIGRAIALEMARHGARVVVSSRKLAACEAVVEEIESLGGEAMAVACHVGDKAELQQLVDATFARYGRIDCLVCNAAVNTHFGPSLGMSDDSYDKIMDTNVRSTFWLCNMVLPQMADRREGTVILLASVAGLAGNGKIGVYGMSKAATMQLARNLAVEWGRHNVRINCIAPGVVRTDFARALWSDERLYQRLIEQYPLRRIGAPRDVAGVAVFLASRASDWMTGQTLVIDGGGAIMGPENAIDPS
jgi:NAD(P)-dependent dehydrogenase (short-subunit alcohol dehydrogenase family)